ncbi:MAG: hypothetical protein ACXW6J_19000 [Candidatus Binatia bacterium]
MGTVEPKVILARPDDHRGILCLQEAVDAMLEAFRYWARDLLVAELRRRTHTPKTCASRCTKARRPASVPPA